MKFGPPLGGSNSSKPGAFSMLYTEKYYEGTRQKINTMQITWEFKIFEKDIFTQSYQTNMPLCRNIVHIPPQYVYINIVQTDIHTSIYKEINNLYKI